VAFATRGDVRLHYEIHGERGPHLLLLNGLGDQLIRFRAEFLAALTSRGLHLVVMDNRDVGLSTHLDAAVPRLEDVLAARRAGRRPEVPYLLADMADDAVAVLDAIGVERAHVAGFSMGGMIAQELALRHGERVLSLTSVMSTTGDPDVGHSTPAAQTALLAPVPRERSAYVERMIANARVYGSPDHHDPAEIAERAGAAFDRAFHPEGTARQFMAIVASGSRTERLGALRVPTLVIHGSDDALIDPSGGRRTAEAVPGAQLEIVEGLGHDLPLAFMTRVTTFLADFALAQPRD
jgi:pimeloyl-ACP methyl ester carboxylesterase